MTSSPVSIEAALRSAFEKHQRHQFRDAIVLYRNILERQSKHFDALQLLGLCYYQNGQAQDALTYLNAALTVRRDVASVFNNRGTVLRHLGRKAEAISDFDTAIRLKPSFADAYYNKGNALRDARQFKAAQQCYEQAVKLNPGRLEFITNLAGVLSEDSNDREALKWYDRAIEINPDSSDSHMNRGLVLHKLMRFHEAVASYDNAIRSDPFNAAAHSGRADSLRELGRLNDALASSTTALELRPDLPEAHGSHGGTLKELKRFDDALRSYDRAIALRPDYAEAHGNRGVVLRELKRLDEALESHDRAIALKPDYAEAYSNRGVVLKELRRPEEALRSYDRAIALQPDYAEAVHNKSHLLLSDCKFEEGFALYASRWHVKDAGSPPLNTTLPRWDGSPFAGDLLLWAEQGIGDEILYASMLSLIPKSELAISLAADRRLHSIYQRSFPGLRLLDRAIQKQPIHAGFDAQAAMGDLGELLKLSTDTIKQRRYPFLVADEEGKRNLTAANAFLRGRPVCGLAWKSANKKVGEEKSIRLRDLEPLLGQPDITFVNLQYGDVTDEIENVKESLGIEVHQVPGLDVFNDIDGLLSLIDVCDVVLTTSNVTAHLAGAIGKKAAVLLSSGTSRFWYWQGEPACIWYPSLRLFGQLENGDWSVPIEQAAGWVKENT